MAKTTKPGNKPISLGDVGGSQDITSFLASHGHHVSASTDSAENNVTKSGESVGSYGAQSDESGFDERPIDLVVVRNEPAKPASQLTAIEDRITQRNEAPRTQQFCGSGKKNEINDYVSLMMASAEDDGGPSRHITVSVKTHKLLSLLSDYSKTTPGKRLSIPQIVQNIVAQHKRDYKKGLTAIVEEVKRQKEEITVL